MKNLLIVLSGPSGVGKGTVVKRLMARGGFALSVSCTTREPRDGEVDGVAYHFISREKFLETVEKGGFLEYDCHFENYYGTPREYVERELEKRNVLLEIDVDGALQVKKSYPGAILIMLTPPSVEELRARLAGRGTESPEKIEERIRRMEYELSKKHLYDYVLVNDELEKCVKDVLNIIEKEGKK